jgi:ribonuclease P protein component
MIASRYRLSENEVKKVLKQKKPFFSHTFVANVMKNNLGVSRFAILLSGKHAPGSVNRNYWRRLYYTRSEPYVESPGVDIVLVPKK